MFNFTPGDRVATEFGNGTVRQFTARHIVIDIDGEDIPLNIVTGTPGFERIAFA